MADAALALACAAIWAGVGAMVAEIRRVAMEILR